MNHIQIQLLLRNKDGYLYYETPVDDDYEYFDVYRVKNRESDKYR